MLRLSLSIQITILVIAIPSCFAGTSVAQSVVATVGVGNHPTSVGVNIRTNQIYVANSSDNTVSVIDGSTNLVTATIPGVTFGQSVSVNPVTNRIYVDEFETDNIAGINGLTLQKGQITVTTQAGPTSSQAVAVNSKTNRIYVCSNDQIVVLDGHTNTTITTVSVPFCNFALGVDETRNLIYVGTLNHSINVIDGNTNTIANIFSLTALPNPTTLSVDSTNNRLAVDFNTSGGLVQVLDTATGTVLGTVDGLNSPETALFVPKKNILMIVEGGANKVSFASTLTFRVGTGLPVGNFPIGATINPATGLAYVANFVDGTVTIIALH